jgi:hypothetical protein
MGLPICGRIAPHLPVREHFVGTSEIEATIAKCGFIFPCRQNISRGQGKKFPSISHGNFRRKGPLTRRYIIVRRTKKARIREFALLIPVRREMCCGDRFVSDCAHHHPVIGNRTPFSFVALIPPERGLFDTLRVSVRRLATASVPHDVGGANWPVNSSPTPSESSHAALILGNSCYPLLKAGNCAEQISSEMLDERG